MSRSPVLLETLYQHVCLPPNLPGHWNVTDELNRALFDRLIAACRLLREKDSEPDLWDNLRHSLDGSRILNLRSKLDAKTLTEHFTRLTEKTFIILQITEQNAGIYIHRVINASGDHVLFDSFESSPMSQQVLSTDVLTMDFPASSVAVPFDTFFEMRQELADFLEQASGESVRQFTAKAFKAGSSSREYRDTSNQMAPVTIALSFESVYEMTFAGIMLTGLGGVHQSNFVNDIVPCSNPESLALARSKLGRRMAKIDQDTRNSPVEVKPRAGLLLNCIEMLSMRALQNANQRIERVWSEVKQKSTKRVPKLSQTADPAALRLSLSNSGKYLDKVLRNWRLNLLPAEENALSHQQNTSSSKFSQFIDRYLNIAAYEEDIRTQQNAACSVSLHGSSEFCIESSSRIREYMDLVADFYNNDPLQKSQLLLNVLEIWVQIDRHASYLYPTLCEYHTGFSVDSLGTLILPNVKDLKRLREIEKYISLRNRSCENSSTVFQNPRKGCFAERYFDRTHSLQNVLEDINEWVEEQRARTETEWKQRTAEYESLSIEIAGLSCTYVADNDALGGIVHDPNCPKWSRLRVKVFEEPLPSELAVAKSIVFELCCPDALSAYRDSTWLIQGVLGHIDDSNDGKSKTSKILLRDFASLRNWNKNTTSLVTLASHSKSYRQTHYNSLVLPVDLDELFKPCSLYFRYFDSVAEAWVETSSAPRFAHHTAMLIPPSSPFSSLQSVAHAASRFEGHSSYEIVANQAGRPPNVTAHEYTAYQSLLCSKNLRWNCILLELASSNLNFSEASATLVSHLAGQAGPCKIDDDLRVFHVNFQDSTFCYELLDQTRTRMNNIRTNWRENHCMDMLLTLLLRLWSFRNSGLYADSETRNILKNVLQLLKEAREITLEWIRLLYIEAGEAMDVESSRTTSQYTFWSAILARKTFAVFLDTESVSNDTLGAFFGTSIALRDNLPVNIYSQPHALQSALRNDVKLTFELRHLLKKALVSDPECFIQGLDLVWPRAEGPQRSLSSPSFIVDGGGNWFQATLKESHSARGHIVEFHLLQGILLVDRKPIGKLPTEHRKSPMVLSLFGSLNLRTVLSTRYGMQYRVLQPMHGHEIHLGLRNGSLVARAYIGSTVLECVPGEIFYGSETRQFDLPTPLIENCVHWLDLNTGILEIRPSAQKWLFKNSNWSLDFHARQARRFENVLLNPDSFYFKRLAEVLRGFERPEQLLVFQRDGKVRCEIRRMSLSFVVNRLGYLHSFQYGSVDPNQDVGTWYGLASKLVFRDAVNAHKRFVLVPTGKVVYERHGLHVSIHVEGNGDYLRYTINDVVGRIDCAAEPALIYAKAMFHALTSFPSPDPLTNRTGTEEALDFLSSGVCQPWCPLPAGLSGQSLDILAQLSPKRDYYPEELKNMQRVLWNANIPFNAQHEGFRFLVDAIREQSQNLSTFALQSPNQFPEIPSGGDSFLLTRARVRRAVYERSRTIRPPKTFKQVVQYGAREGLNIPVSNIYDIVSLIRQGCSDFDTTGDLIRRLQQSQVIGGFDKTFNRTYMGCFRVDLELEWGSLARFCRDYPQAGKSRLMFIFSLLLFAHPAQIELIRTLLAYSLMDDMKKLEVPPWPSYVNFHSKLAPTVEAFVHLIKPLHVPYTQQLVTNGAFAFDFRTRAKIASQERAYHEKVENDAHAFAEYVVRQWPSESLSFDGFSSEYIKVSEVAALLAPEWERLIHNHHLLLHLQDVQKILASHTSKIQFSLHERSDKKLEHFPDRIRGGEARDLSAGFMALERELPKEMRIGLSQSRAQPKDVQIMPNDQNKDVGNDSKAICELRSILAELAHSESDVQQQYSTALNNSIDAFTTREIGYPDQHMPPNISNLSSEITEAKRIMDSYFHALCNAFSRNDSCANWLQHGWLWPVITPITLLQQLRCNNPKTFGVNMKELLVAYAVSITTLQRLLRIYDASQRNDKDKLAEELHNKGHENWNPLDRPDWLLLEIDSNLLFRRSQVDVALETIAPRSGSNSVLQMNMGQGKTSCVIPMAAVILANKKQLTRVIVTRSLLLQTAQLLQIRVGGLVGRRIIHIPFARKTSTTPETTNLYGSIHLKAMRRGDLVIALPEHMLSFSLSGQQRLTENRLLEATAMIHCQSWLQKVCRDIMDESDFTLACKTQLIYPSGTQVSFDGGNYRWETPQLLLQFVRDHLWDLKDRFEDSIEIVERQGGFPIVFFLNNGVQQALLSKLVQNVCSGLFPMLPVSHLTSADRSALRAFISVINVSVKDLAQVSKMYPDRPSARLVLHLLRGLLVHRILLMALSRRWNVQYGLHPNRDPVAVPFTAKGVPSDAAEWGHPDVCVLFTILSFYYNGLDTHQIRQTLDYIQKSDDPAAEYEIWTSDIATLPNSLREISAINIDDLMQLKELSAYLRYRTRIIDCYLNVFVFPCYAKQFRRKLQASGWDLPLFAINKDRSAITTGFSGTNDNRDILPLTIKQHDLPSLSHTNAEVLTYLLHDRNRRYVVAKDRDGKRLSEVEILRQLSLRKIRILIDAGAQILELDNLGLVRQWLQVDTGAPAAVYFDSNNKAMVLYRNDRKVPLVSSPFAENLGEALLYLDEAHTRGTDLKLPREACAGLTLGLGQTKDHTVQAAMRCRNLSTSQSVLWIATPEVHHSILQIRSNNSLREIDSRDIVLWLLHNSCVNISQLQPLYYAQGMNYCERAQAWYKNRGFLSDENQRSALVSVIQDRETIKLEELYHPKRRESRRNAVHAFVPELSRFRRELGVLRKGFSDTGNAVHPSALQEVEQEREVQQEVEVVRQVQKPVKYTPLFFPGLHQDLILFATTGRILATSAAYENAFHMVQKMGLRRKHTINAQSLKATNLYCSTEFCRTVQEAGTARPAHIQRNVNWILWSPTNNAAIVVIPEEAEKLIAIIRESPKQLCFLLTYSAPTTRRMLTYFNNLNFYSIPPLPATWEAPRWLTVALGIFAGRLYFDFREYGDLIQFLGARHTELQSKDANTSNINEETEDRAEEKEEPSREQSQKQVATKFTDEPLVFLQDWLAIRRNDQDFTNTPMGFVCHGKTLTADHPFFTGNRVNTNSVEAKDNGLSYMNVLADTAAGEVMPSDDQSDDGMFDFDDELGNDVIEEMEAGNIQDEEEEEDNGDDESEETDVDSSTSEDEEDDDDSDEEDDDDDDEIDFDYSTSEDELD
ncbi:MAG: hypothetical protein Q9227_002524 [Pyrenula ochraceoflavens]